MKGAQHQMNSTLHTSAAAVDWPATPDGDYARRFLSPLLEEGTAAFVANVATAMQIVRVGAVTLPITVGPPASTTTGYVASPFNQYVTYAGEEMRELRRPVAVGAARLLLQLAGGWLQRAQIDQTVMINNWLLSTNLYPVAQRAEIDAVHRLLLAHFPAHTLLWRSVDGQANPGLLAQLQALGYRPIFSRQIYYQDVRNPELLRKKQVKIDLAKLRKSTYRLLTHEEIPPAALPRLKALYDDLYLRKYSFHNPQFTHRFFAHMHAERLLELRALAANREIDGILGYFSRTGASGLVQTQPLFGYDTGLPQEAGLYRLLSTQTLLEGAANHRLIHASAGVGPFKRLRGGVGAIEYNLVYDRHLPDGRRRPWRFLEWLSHRVVIPLVVKLGV